MHKKLYDLKQEFLNTWPIERLERMTLEEYTNLDKTSFCYWLEAITSDLGSIKGGSSYKFGIFKRKDLESDNFNEKRKSDGQYSWYGKYGDTKEEVFKRVRQIIKDIAVFSEENKLQEIDKIDIGDTIKWKVAFLYGNFNCLNAFKLDALRVIASNLEIEYNNKTPVSKFHKEIVKLKPVDQDYFSWSYTLWKQYEMRLIDVKKDFAKWLNHNTFDSYRAYLGYTTKSIENRLDEINSYFDEVDFFLVDPNGINGLVSTIFYLMSKKERVKNPDFVEYDTKNSNGIPKAILGKNNYIKFLKEKFDYQSPNYWIFQGSPNIYNITKALNAGHLNSWKVAAHKDKIQVGDQVILWQTGTQAGCYALAEVISEVGVFKEEDLELQYYTIPQESTATDRVKIRITKNLANTPILWSNLKDNPKFSVFKAGNQGTNFSATEEEFNALLNWKSTTNIMNGAIINSTSKSSNTMSINNILYGPPGTGKTYGTIVEALKIVDNDFYRANKNNRAALTRRYQDLLITEWKDGIGQIGFCTFHQSFTYEDFVEGIKPQITKEKNVYYDILPGIFKKICELADGSRSASKVKKEGNISWTSEQFNEAFFYKLSLGEANNPEDQEIYEFCIKNNYVAIGFGNDFDYTGMSEKQIKEKCAKIDENSSSGSQLSTFIHGLSKNNYVLISKGNLFVRALGRIVGDYEYHEDSPIRYSHFRKVEWLFVNENIPIEDLYDTTLTQRTIYKIDHDKLKREFFVSDHGTIESDEKKIKPYVLIIDEINRGNVASIFGELITLIEPDKRSGAKEKLEVLLPYSKEKFSVPDNLYIIGTMNTADRSVEALDTALRRRFVFKEVMPDPSLLVGITFNGFNLAQVLTTINDRIEVLLDRDHTIGHSYFIKLERGDTEGLLNVFKNNIVPLLQEYFYNDYEKIALVLGSGFVQENGSKKVVFPKFNNIDEPEQAVSYELRNSIDDIEKAVGLLLGGSNE
ncbi:EVE domain-containing protein [Arenibacter latericius]|uniref:EVE domain-containing protein n=1 Tax=Arenibacter latericius TaxID=86104 RepID=UPI0003FFBA19|nr:EVE domain-containing protein [Arenibacter latericius]